MAEFAMTIDGKAVKGKKTVGVINPATGKIFTEVPDCSKEELDQAMAAAARAFPASRLRRICRSGARSGRASASRNGPWGLLGFPEIQVVNVAKA